MRRMIRKIPGARHRWRGIRFPSVPTRMGVGARSGGCTKAFATACPLFGTLIALQHRGQPVLGAIHQPVLNQLVIGDGRTTTLNGRPVRTRPTRRIEEATLLTSDPLNPARTRTALPSPRSRPGEVGAHLGRLLWLSARRDRLGRRHVRPDHESVGHSPR